MDVSDDSFVDRARLLQIAGVKRSTWENWCRSRLVEPPSDGVYSLEMVVDSAVVAELRRALDLEEIRAAWDEIREELRASRGRLPQLDLVFDHRYGQAAMTRTLEDLATAVRTGRPVTVVPLAEVLGLTTEAFKRFARPRADIASDGRSVEHGNRRQLVGKRQPREAVAGQRTKAVPKLGSGPQPALSTTFYDVVFDT